MFLDFPYRSSAPISVPGCQANFFKDAGEFFKLHAADVNIRMLFVSALVNRSNEVCINRVEVEVLSEIKFVAGEAQSDRIIDSG